MFDEEVVEEVHVNIKVILDRVKETFEYQGRTEVSYHLVPVIATYDGGSADVGELDGLLESLTQSDFGQIHVKDALLHALGGQTSGIKRN